MEQLIPDDTALRVLLDAIPSFVFIADREVRILDANRAARRWIGDEPGSKLNQLGGNVLNCIFSREPGGCGRTDACPSCLIRESVEAVRPDERAPNRLAHTILETAGRKEDRWFRVSASPLALDGRDLVLLVLEEVTQLVELREVLPFCPGCGTPRDREEVDQEAQIYLRRHPGAWSARELCPTCQRQQPPAPWREDLI